MDIRDLSPMASGAADASAEPATQSIPAPKRRWLTRVLLPVIIMTLTAGLLAYASRDTLLPATPVQVVRVIAKEGGQQAASESTDQPAVATVSVQAPGWVEPDPYPVYVTALTDGVIKKVNVLEGDPVKAGQVVAEMIDDDASLALARAEAELALSKARLAAAKTDWDEPIALKRAVAVSNSALAEMKAKLAQLAAAVAQQKAKLEELASEYNRLRKTPKGVVSDLEVEQAMFRYNAQQAMVVATQQQQPVLEAMVAQQEAEVAAAAANLRLRVNLRMAVDVAQASVADHEAAVGEAQLRLSRMKIVSPVDGIVMTRMVAPGAKVMLGMDEKHSAHVVHVYDPSKLQVRVDVPLADAAKVGVGQAARVIVDVLPDKEFVGRVTRFVHQADIGKNTVEVKVAIEAPSALLKPDMLARVKFLATPNNDAGSTTAGAISASSLTVYVPQSAVQSSGNESHVWVVSPTTAKLRLQSVTLGDKRSDGWVAVVAGLSPGDVLVAKPTNDLKQDQRVAMVEMDNDK